MAGASGGGGGGGGGTESKRARDQREAVGVGGEKREIEMARLCMAEMSGLSGVRVVYRWVDLPGEGRERDGRGWEYAVMWWMGWTEPGEMAVMDGGAVVMSEGKSCIQVEEMDVDVCRAAWCCVVWRGARKE